MRRAPLCEVGGLEAEPAPEVGQDALLLLLAERDKGGEGVADGADLGVAAVPTQSRSRERNNLSGDLHRGSPMGGGV